MTEIDVDETQIDVDGVYRAGNVEFRERAETTTDATRRDPGDPRRSAAFATSGCHVRRFARRPLTCPAGCTSSRPTRGELRLQFARDTERRPPE